MKRIISLVLMLCVCTALAVSLSSCNTPVGEAHMGYKIISDEKVHDYVLEVPDDWTVTSQNGYLNAVAAGAADDRSNVSVMTSLLNSEISTPEKYYDNLIASYTEMYDNVQTLSRDVDVKLGDENAKKYEFTADILGKSYKFQQVLCTRGDRIYIVTYTSTPEYYDTHTEDVKEILHLFRFRM